MGEHRDRDGGVRDRGEEREHVERVERRVGGEQASVVAIPAPRAGRAARPAGRRRRSPRTRSATVTVGGSWVGRRNRLHVPHDAAATATIAKPARPRRGSSERWRSAGWRTRRDTVAWGGERSRGVPAPVPCRASRDHVVGARPRRWHQRQQRAPMAGGGAARRAACSIWGAATARWSRGSGRAPSASISHRRARPDARRRLVAGPAQALPFADRAFDACVCHLAFMLFDDARIASSPSCAAWWCRAVVSRRCSAVGRPQAPGRRRRVSPLPGDRRAQRSRARRPRARERGGCASCSAVAPRAFERFELDLVGGVRRGVAVPRRELPAGRRRRRGDPRAACGRLRGSRDRAVPGRDVARDRPAVLRPPGRHDRRHDRSTNRCGLVREVRCDGPRDAILAGATRGRPCRTLTPPRPHASNLRTLAIDIGGTGLKALILGADGDALTERVRVETPRPATPDALLPAIVEAGRAARRVRSDQRRLPGRRRRRRHADRAEPPQARGAASISRRRSTEQLGRPVRVLNDAGVQGYGVIEGHGVEMVLTLGTGLGCALYHRRPLRAQPRARAPSVRQRQDLRGVRRRPRRCARIGKKKWNHRVDKVIAQVLPVWNPRHLYLGGGNAKHLKIDAAAAR